MAKKLTNADIPTSCDGCGACCMGQNLLPIVYPTSLLRERWPKKLKAESLALLRRPYTFRDGECPCVWLDRANARCMHYEHRPPPCRNMAVGSGGCLRARTREGKH